MQNCFNWPAAVSVLALATIAGCDAQSPYKKAAGNAVAVADAVVASIESGRLTYGEFDRHQSRMKAVPPTLLPQSSDPGKAAAQSAFGAGWDLFESTVSLLGTTKFLDEKLERIGSGGISPAYAASVGVDEIRKIKSIAESLKKTYAELR